MSERRCPNCGGLVGADAEWCTQCFTRLQPVEEPPSEPGEAEPPAEAQPVAPTGIAEGPPARAQPPRPAPADLPGERLIRPRGEAIVWQCPTCGTENPIEAPVCSACGTQFRQMLQEPEPPVEVDPGRAAMLSLIFPGVGHIVIGRRSEGIARAVVFAFAIVTGFLALNSFRGGGGTASLLLMVLAFGAAAGLYVISTLDAGRAASREEQLLASRVLMYGGVGLMLLTLAVVVLGALGARG